jgi:hypothetical protein
MCVSRVVPLKGRTDVQNGARSGLPSVITEGLKHRVDAHVRENRRFTVGELHEVFSRVPRAALYEDATVQPRYRNICAEWVTRMLAGEHKQTDWSNGLDGDCYDEVIFGPVRRLVKCLNRNGDYVEK